MMYPMQRLPECSITNSTYITVAFGKLQGPATCMKTPSVHLVKHEAVNKIFISKGKKILIHIASGDATICGVLKLCRTILVVCVYS